MTLPRRLCYLRRESAGRTPLLLEQLEHADTALDTGVLPELELGHHAQV
ncbi:MAG: hypothetical protein QM758_08280 [Armatimonas sp.]